MLAKFDQLYKNLKLKMCSQACMRTNFVSTAISFVTGIWKEVSAKLPHWVLFNVCIALAPLVLNYLKASLFAETNGQDFLSSLSLNGELFIISTAILGESVGDLVTSKNEGRVATVIGGVCVLLLISTTFLFAAVTTSDTAQAQVDNSSAISRMSLHFFYASFFMSACCKLMASSSDSPEASSSSDSQAES